MLLGGFLVSVAMRSIVAFADGKYYPHKATLLCGDVEVCRRLFTCLKKGDNIPFLMSLEVHTKVAWFATRVGG